MEGQRWRFHIVELDMLARKYDPEEGEQKACIVPVS